MSIVQKLGGGNIIYWIFTVFERLVLLNYQAIKELMLKNASVFQPNNLTDPFYILQWLSWHVHEYSTTPKFQTVTINSNSSSYQSELSNFYMIIGA